LFSPSAFFSPDAAEQQGKAPLADRRRLSEVVERWQGLRIVVLGDALLDEWCYGRPDRLSREAPVPIVEMDQVEWAPGGAANTALNIAALGARPVLVAPVGDDPTGSRLRQCLTESGVDARLVVVPGRRTQVKRRVVANDQIVVRVDAGSRGAVPDDAQQNLVAAVESAMLPAPAAVAVCDYGCGAIGPTLIGWLGRQRETLPVLAVDAHHLARWSVVHPTLVTPSFVEAADLIGAAEGGCDHPTMAGTTDRMSIVECNAERVLDRTGAQIAAITLDAEGTIVVGRDAASLRTTTHAVPAGHTVGAGDAYLAALTLSVATGADLSDAVAVAQLAAATSIRGPRTCVSQVAGLLAQMSPASAHAAEAADQFTALVARVRSARARGARLVFTNGCFDVLHRGHVTFLRQARSLGDLLVVAVNSDASVARLKGSDRPVNHVEDRAAVLGELSCVDHVVLFDEDSPVRLIEELRPDVYVKGGDYRVELLPEAALVRRLGGEVRILDYVPDRSTSAIIEKIRSSTVVRA
jgi:D-beta-D-heptose 7-phosphate kinase / D-beta-D-heptose 1-phosphate adenosyltransferase